MNGGYRGGQGSGRGSGYGGQEEYGEDAYGGPSYPAARRPGYYDGQGHGQQGGRPPAGGRPGHRPQGPAGGPQSYPRSGSQQVQRGTEPRRMSGGYDEEYRYGQGGNPDWDDDSFVPGFGGRDDADPRGRGRDPRGGDPRGADPRGGDPRGGDPRGGDPRGGDPRGGDPRDWRDWDPRDRDPRDPRARGGDGRRPGGPGGRGPGGRGPDDRDGRGAGPRGRDPRDREAWPDYHTEKRRRSPIRRLAPWIALLVIVTPIAIGLTYIYHRYEAKYHPADYTGPGTGEVTVQVMSGDTAFSLAPRLVALGVIASDRAFENAAEAAPANGPGLEAGYFEMHRHMQASLAYAYLTNPKNMLQTVVTIPEGKRVSQVISILSAATKIPAKDFQDVIDHPAQLGLPVYAKGVKGYPDSAVEGFLFPATYAITPHETALQILQAMVKRFDVEAQAINITAAAKSVHLTPYELIIEASMAQAEGGSVSDYPKIATVIKNREAAGMVLGFDSVLFYGLNTYGVNVTAQQEAINTPYNDLKYHKGLPPTPIDNPGDAAIQGILHPTPGDWLYFLTNTGGKSTFSATPLPGQ